SAPPGGGASGGNGGNSSASGAWSGATEITSATTQSGKTYASTTADQNALLVSTSDAVALTNPTVTKSGGTSASDDYSFYGINSAVMCKGGGTTTITGGTVNTTAAGANGVFSYGENSGQTNATGDGTTVNISGTIITTTGQGSGGIMTTYGGTTNASDLTVTTSGGSSAPIRTDKGGGWVTVDGGTYTSSGTGSPAIYSTADVEVSNATLVSKASEGTCIEGNGSIALTDCDLTASNTEKNGKAQFYDSIMIYQSMSGDATGTDSVFSMTGGKLTSNNGHVFHVTNTSAEIDLNGVSIANNDSDGVLLSVANDGWSGNANAATVNATGQVLEGDVIVSSAASSESSSASSLELNLAGGSSLSGKIDDGAGSNNFKAVAVTIDSDSLWVLSGDSYVSSVSGGGKINYNGHTLTIGSTTYSGSNPVDGLAATDETASGSSENPSSGGESGTGSSKVALSDCAATIADQAYTGSAIKPEVTVTYAGEALVEGTDYTVGYSSKKVAGKAVVTISGIGDYTGTKDVAFVIKPAKVAGVSVKSAKAGKATVSWSNANAVAAGATGYQIRYKVAGQSAKTVLVKDAKAASKVLSKLAKGKKVTCKVRAYKTVDGTKHFGAYSAAKSAKVKR
ncbi:MAG: fibronectin type III domain-containing protein, partial [Eggerthellaceae bacterium]|nr:fibronectin type III domain-containing protein [Eggerthellaceae bacterium]